LVTGWEIHGSNPRGVPIQTEPKAHRACYIIRTGSLAGVRRLGCVAGHRCPSSAVVANVKERRPTSGSALCLHRHVMACPSHLLSYTTPYPSNGDTIEHSVLLRFCLYVRMFTHENNYDLPQRLGGRRSQIVKCLCTGTDIFQLKIYYVKMQSC
jgi:hypothetical protein